MISRVVKDESGDKKALEAAIPTDHAAPALRHELSVFPLRMLADDLTAFAPLTSVRRRGSVSPNG